MRDRATSDASDFEKIPFFSATEMSEDDLARKARRDKHGRCAALQAAARDLDRATD